jgi:hypothetical protein
MGDVDKNDTANACIGQIFNKLGRFDKSIMFLGKDGNLGNSTYFLH